MFTQFRKTVSKTPIKTSRHKCGTAISQTKALQPLSTKVLCNLSYHFFNCLLFYCCTLQEQAKLDASKQQVTSPEECDDLSPMPQTTVPPVRRRGAISAEPVTEEDATGYVKKVRNHPLNSPAQKTPPLTIPLQKSTS